MSVKIIVDSGCDIPQSEGEQLGIRILPLRYILKDKEYLDGITISNHEFYELLESDDIFPKTSQITPFQYGEEFEKALKDHDEVICITMSSGVSGCYQSALLASEDFDGKVKVFDSHHFCFSYTILVKYAVMLRDRGCNAQQIYDGLSEALKKVRLIATFDTLEYLRRGGRISGAVGFIGEKLAIKPSITITDGKVDVLKVVRGKKKGFICADEYIAENGEIDFDMPYCCGYTGSSDEMMVQFMEEYGNKWFEGHEKPQMYVVGTTVGSYAGPGAYCIAYFVK